MPGLLSYLPYLDYELKILALPVPGPPVKKRRRDEINAAVVVEDVKEVSPIINFKGGQ